MKFKLVVLAEDHVNGKQYTYTSHRGIQSMKRAMEVHDQRILDERWATNVLTVSIVDDNEHVWKTYTHKSVQNYDSGCKGKKGFSTQSNARKHLFRFHGEKADEEFNTYHCDFCDLWHNGHKST